MKHVLIMIVGFSRSGKSTLVNQIIKNFSTITKIDTDSIHDFLNQTYSVFKDENTIEGKSFDIRQKSTRAIQEALISTLLADGHSVLLDSCNLSKAIRDTIFTLARESDQKITTILIRHKINEDALYENIRKADQEKGGTIWKDLYEKIQKPALNEPSASEVDHLMIHKKNTKEIIDKIQSILRG
ncbi:ATP-binding protein [Patescibacteria group bacterium]|nr:ATP-binding protein [Patescibacteria group bacterium]